MIDILAVINQAKRMLEEGQPENALAVLDIESIGYTAEVFFLKGEIYFKLQQWGEALNHFSAYLEQFPQDKRAESYCTMIRNILGFYHKDLYNP